MRCLLIIAVTFLHLTAPAQSFDYLPEPVEGSQVIVYTQFTLSYNETHEQADWVAYQLTSHEVQLDLDRCDCFARDERVNTASATASDYVSTGFDMGHLSPAADNNLSEIVNRESFLMSNISPQLPTFNRGVWSELESWVRQMAIQHDSVFVVTGPVFVGNLGKIGDNQVTIPGYFYKVLLRFENGSPKTIGFLFPHIGSVGSFQEYQVPVNTIETLSGLDFFPMLSSSIENRVEAQLTKSGWGLDQ